MVDTPEQGVAGVVVVADPQEVISLHRPDHHPSHALVITVLCFDSKGLIIVITNPLITPAREYVQSDRVASQLAQVIPVHVWCMVAILPLNSPGVSLVQ